MWEGEQGLRDSTGRCVVLLVYGRVSARGVTAGAWHAHLLGL